MIWSMIVVYLEKAKSRCQAKQGYGYAIYRTYSILTLMERLLVYFSVLMWFYGYIKGKMIGQLHSASKVLLGFEQPSQPAQHLFASSIGLCDAPCTSCLPLPRFSTNYLRMFPLTQLS